jgi:hypothetical protein
MKTESRIFPFKCHHCEFQLAIGATIQTGQDEIQLIAFELLATVFGSSWLPVSNCPKCHREYSHAEARAVSIYRLITASDEIPF